MGVAYRLAPPSQPGGSWTEKVLYSFGSQSGDWGLSNGVVLSSGGVLYGTAKGSQDNCLNGCGDVFELISPSTPGGTWTETILHAFAGDAAGDGSQPELRTRNRTWRRSLRHHFFWPGVRLGNCIRAAAPILAGRLVERGNPLLIHRRTRRRRTDGYHPGK